MDGLAQGVARHAQSDMGIATIGCVVLLMAVALRQPPGTATVRNPLVVGAMLALIANYTERLTGTISIGFGGGLYLASPSDGSRLPP